MAELSRLSERQDRLRGVLQNEELDAVLLLDPVNIRYLCGFSGSESLLLLEDDSSILVVDGRYTEQAREEVRLAGVLEYVDKMEGIQEVLTKRNPRRLGFEAPSLTYDRYEKLRKGIPKSVELVPLEQPLLSLRVCKDPGEVALLKQAADVASEALQKTLAALRPGMTEREAARLLDWNMVQGGGEGPAFDTIVASGRNGAMPHARPGEKFLEEGELVVIDYGVLLGGYNSDESCTIALGKPSPEACRVYGTVLEAHDRAIEAVRPGVLCKDIDAVARACIDDAGYGSCFVHGAGHGLGMKVHEAPSLSRRSSDTLLEGMVITIEPGIYLPGRFGVRIEDTVLVTSGGCEIISRTTKRLVIL